MRATTASNPFPVLPPEVGGGNNIVITTTLAPDTTTLAPDRYASPATSVYATIPSYNQSLCLVHYNVDVTGHAAYGGNDAFFVNYRLEFSDQSNPKYWYISIRPTGGQLTIIGKNYNIDEQTAPLDGWIEVLFGNDLPETIGRTTLSNGCDDNTIIPPSLTTSGGFWSIPSCLTKYESALDATETCSGIDDGGQLVYSTRVAAQGAGELWIYTMVIFFLGRWSIIEFPDCLIQGNYTVLSTTTDLNVYNPEVPPNNSSLWTNGYQVSFSQSTC
jgi:hypothetical protein